MVQIDHQIRIEDLNILIKNRGIGIISALSKRAKFRDRKTSYAK